MEEIAYAPKYPKVKLPHPFLTSYRVAVAKDTTPAALCLVKDNTTDGKQLPEPLHLESLWWLDLVWQPKEQVPPLSNNWPYARAQRSPETRFSWQEKAIPTLGQIWGVTHAIFVAHPACEGFRLNIQGAEEQNIRHVMLATGLAIPHPTSPNGEGQDYVNELFVLRSAFWQGAASPIGPRPIWLCEDTAYGKDRAHYPLLPETFHFTTKFPKEPIHTYHPRRPQKPRPGSIVYSRYVPEIDEHFSLEAVNWQDEEHLRLFNTWHNDPRVAAGWNETGTMDEHRAYLKKLNDDPHEDHYGAHYDAGNYDRGRHALVGDVAFRGAKRVNAWYSSFIHYCFLDDPRTANVVGEPKAIGSIVLSYETSQGLTIGKYVDLGHKRSVHSICSREKWFQLCPLFWDGRDRPLESADRAAWNAKL